MFELEEDFDDQMIEEEDEGDQSTPFGKILALVYFDADQLAEFRTGCAEEDSFDELTTDVKSWTQIPPMPDLKLFYKLLLRAEYLPGARRSAVTGCVSSLSFELGVKAALKFADPTIQVFRKVLRRCGPQGQLHTFLTQDAWRRRNELFIQPWLMQGWSAEEILEKGFCPRCGAEVASFF